MITSSTGILFVLAANAGLWFYLQRRTGSNLFNYIPPLMFIYVLSAVFSNTGLIVPDSELYDWMGSTMLPFLIVMMLLDVDVAATLKVAGKGVFVMLIGTVGVIVGAPIGYFVVKGWLDPEAWKGYGALAGSWIGGTGNMAAVAQGLGTSGTHFGLAVIADNVVYLVWLPLLLQSKNLAKWFHKFTGVSDERIRKMKSAAGDMAVEKGKPQLWDFIYLIALGSGVTYLSTILSELIPEAPPILSASTYRILLVTTFGIVLSFTPARRIPASQELGIALVHLFVARMGAKTVVAGLAGQAVPFVAGAFIWIFIHGAFILFASRIFKIDVHIAAISSAANIGAAATAPVVAAYHDERLVPVSILMALLGYAIGNYAAFFAAWLCELVA